MISFYIRLNKFISKACKIFKKNGNQLPGYFVYDVFKKHDILKYITFPKNVIAVTGSSGKGTTCNHIKDILENAGLKVAYNNSGNNGILGVITHILNNCNSKGIFEKDVLLLECDERHLKLIFKYFNPHFLVVTNITRDQPSRNGDPNETFKEINKLLNKDIHLVVNADDPIVNKLTLNHQGKITKYSLDNIKDYDYNVSDLNNIDASYCPICKHKLIYKYYHYGHLGEYKCPNNDFKKGPIAYLGKDLDLNKGLININSSILKMSIKTSYNGYSMIASYAIADLINIDKKIIEDSFNNKEQTITHNKELKLKDRTITMIESKNENNLSYFQSIQYIRNYSHEKTIILGFENVSRRYKSNDLSWLYDIDFEYLNNDTNISKIFVIGRFRYDILNRLSYTNIKQDKIVLIDNLDNLLPKVLQESKGMIFTMVCFDMTAIIKKKVENYEKD